jgi:hypothetical protein
VPYWVEIRKSVRHEWQVLNERKYRTEAEARKAIETMPREHYVRFFRQRGRDPAERLQVILSKKLRLRPWSPESALKSAQTTTRRILPFQLGACVNS